MLQAYLINGAAVGTELKTWKSEDLNGNEAFIYSVSPMQGYKDITSIKNIYNFSGSTKHDFKYMRDAAKYFVRQLGISNSTPANNPLLLTPINTAAYLITAPALGEWLGKEGQIAIWNGLNWDYIDGTTGAPPLVEYGFDFIATEEEKKIAATWLIGSVMQQINAFDGLETVKIKAQEQYALKVQEIRKERYMYVLASIHTNLPHKAEEILNILGDRTTHYKNEGLDGLFYNVFGEIVGDFAPTGPILGGLGCWVNSLGYFNNIGLSSKGADWTTLFNKTPLQYAAELNAILFVYGVPK